MTPALGDPNVTAFLKALSLPVLQISCIASHFAPQIQANAMQQHFRIALIAMQNNARVIALSSANLPLTFGSDRRLDYCG